MKLEEKHIVGYLPYELKLQHKFDKAKHGNEEILRPWQIILDHYFLPKLNQSYNWLLILRPLSDLEKDENFNLYMDLCDELGVVRCENLLTALQDNSYYALDIRKYAALEEWMYKNHFDWKYNLIKNGLAIDINSLEKNNE